MREPFMIVNIIVRVSIGPNHNHTIPRPANVAFIRITPRIAPYSRFRHKVSTPAFMITQYRDANTPTSPLGGAGWACDTQPGRKSAYIRLGS